MITVKILADSINPAGRRITSWLLTYPRFIHSEFMTHRVFSRNAASSRAIPIEKMMSAIEENPAWPERWGSKGKGMQDGGELRAEIAGDLRVALDELRKAALATVEIADDIGAAKQIANRYIEPWAHITVLATATDHDNFFALRAHPAAMPEFQVLAYRMLDLYLRSQPAKLAWGNWHIPNFTSGNADAQIASTLATKEDEIKIATARCARLSYLTFDGEHDPAKDMELHDRLLVSGHMSPFEHCAEAVDFDADGARYRWSNFDSEVASCWQQYRKRFENENRTGVDLAAVMATKPEWVTL